MVSRRHDFTDSEPEIEEGIESDIEAEAGPSNPRKRQLSDGPAESSNAGGGYSRGGSEEFDELLDHVTEHSITKPTPPPSKKSKKGKEGGPLKITLRPGINHLINSDSHSIKSTKSKAASTTKNSDRSSLSPPPPITLKFGLKSTMAEKASYSSSENDEPLPIPPPNKKKKTTASSSTGKNKSKTTSQNQNQIDKASEAAAAAVAAQHRKSYDWLAPSVAGASHRGPAQERERERQGSNGGTTSNTGKITGWSPADEAIGGLLDDSPDTTIEKKPKKSHKKKPADAPPGPGKAWRKGIKKGMTTAVKAEEGLSTPGGSPLIHAVTPMSREGSLDLLEIPPRMIAERPIAPAIVPPPRAPSPPFVLADAKELGFPVFSNPIHAPKVPLGAFPKVTQYFAPLNGGDVGPFPRKEPVRNWTHSEKVMVGIAGGQLKIKSWIMGPPSELGRLVQADKDAKEILRLSKIKSNANTNNNNTQGTSTPTSNTPLDLTERPNLTSMNSFDGSNSNIPTPILAPNNQEKNDNDEEMSEIADLDDDSNSNPPQSGATTPIPIPTPTPTPKIKVKVGSGGGSKAKKAAPRKSALRQEIVPSEENSEFELDKSSIVPSEIDGQVVTPAAST